MRPAFAAGTAPTLLPHISAFAAGAAPTYGVYGIGLAAGAAPSRTACVRTNAQLVERLVGAPPGANALMAQRLLLPPSRSGRPGPGAASDFTPLCFLTLCSVH